MSVRNRVNLSTTPAWAEGRLTPRPFALRVFAAATADGWTVMPGGFCRVSNRLDARAVSMDAGAQSSDVWVLTSRPIEWSTLLPSDEDPPIVRVLGNLPSRAADNLFWMGRYLERAEATLRVVRSLGARLGELQHIDLQGRQSIERLARLLIAWGAAPEDMPDMDPTQIAWAAAAGADNYGSALSVVRYAKRAASIVRERLSQDVWQLIGRIETRLTRAGAGAITEPEALEIVERSLHTLAALSGLIDENFNRVAGWSFIDLGRRIERAIGTCRFARQFAGDDATVETLDALLDLLDSQITYRSRYHRRRRAGARPRHGHARSVQSAIRPLPGDAYRRTSRGAAESARRWSDGAAAATLRQAARRARVGRCAPLGRRDHSCV